MLLAPTIDALSRQDDGDAVGGVWVDTTFGRGGHSRALLARLGPDARLIAFDKDTEALANAPKDKRLILVHNNFRFVHNFVKYNGFEKVDGILADLGVSSHQFDTSTRGFSFRFDAPLDMRMNSLSKVNAADIVNSYSCEDLEKVLRIYGEVDNSRRAAEKICAARETSSIRTTGELDKALESVLPKFQEHKYLAKVYQALRIEVNREMDDLKGFMEGSIKSLRSGGRISVITYHSLEDRIVKNYFKAGNVDGEVRRDLMGRGESPYELVHKKPVLPKEEEIAGNTRARSAKLRAAIRK